MASGLERVPLEVTHVLYDESSYSALCLALLTLTPILLNPAYVVLIVYTRELLIVEMYLGQLLCEVANWFLKHTVRQDRPNMALGSGYGFPSSHSQWMGYFSTFLLLHFTFRHSFVSTGWRAGDALRRAALYVVLVAVAGAVAYSRYYLSYHTVPQILWGLGLGAAFASVWYGLLELVPLWYPRSVVGQMKAAVLGNPLCSWFRLRDGWAVWEDGGAEPQWLRWRAEWDRRRGKESQKSR